jgi:hypothetical protein
MEKHTIELETRQEELVSRKKYSEQQDLPTKDPEATFTDSVRG